MVWVAAAAVGLVALYAGARWFASADPKTLVRALRWVGIGAAAVVVAFLAIRGGWGAILPLMVVLPALWRRWGRGLLTGRRGSNAGTAEPTEGQRSGVQTDSLEMTLDHDSGAMDGVIRRGRYKGDRLSGLNFAELLVFLDDCRASDPESVPLVETFLDRAHGTDWRERSEAQQRPQGPSSGPMTREEALEILGLEPGAGPEDIRAAHRRLMRKLHPDSGGSTYLAARINQAKDVLLGS
ncbi:MAG: molecular chaperone DnaJ [Alphaproteobacteria bacterium]|nr:molecular chaperone DnaJ [Alphaproteobacteria bacterium]